MADDEETLYWGVDIGGTTAKYALISNRGKISTRGSFPTGASCAKEEFLTRFFAASKQAVEQGASGFGISCLGIVDSQTGEVRGGAGNFPALTGINLKQELLQRYPDLPVYLCNDVKAAARGEQWLGAGRNCENFFCITFGTGLGGCAVIDSKILEGAFLRAGEIAYWDYQSGTNHCERRLSTGYVMAAAARELGVPSLDGVEFFARIRQKDTKCLRILDNWVAGMARVIANIILLLDPEKFILGGGIAPQYDLLIPMIHRALVNMLPPDFQEHCPIVSAECGNDAGILGAVSMLIGSTRNTATEAGGKPHV